MPAETAGPAVFLDRDGVLNRHVLHAQRGAYEPPHAPAEIALFPWTLASLRRLQAAGFRLFVVSNQPDHAKRKTTLDALLAVQAAFAGQLRAAGIEIAEYAYCHCHPDSDVQGFGAPCACRKPSPWMVQDLLRRHAVDAGRSWLVGDRASDIDCGNAAGLRTIQVRDPHSVPGTGQTTPAARAATLAEAVELILAELPPGKDGENHRCALSRATPED